MRKIRRNEAGFTLMELMVVIVIVAILAAVAVPLYINYVKDAQRTEAKGAIGAVITAEQVYYQQNGATTYAPDLTAVNVDLGVDVKKNWTVLITSATNTAFTITATSTTDPTNVVTYEYDRATTPPTSKWTP